MIRLLQPYEANLKKRLVKAPKLYFRDTGLLHSLLKIESVLDLLSHSKKGESWEAYAIENIISNLSIKYGSRLSAFYLRNSNANEIDLILEIKNKVYLFKFKASKAPSLNRGFYELTKDLEYEQAYLIAPVDRVYQAKHGVIVCNLMELDLLP
jgi:predicted AAA+ superfamily ATPase